MIRNATMVQRENDCRFGRRRAQPWLLGAHGDEHLRIPGMRQDRLDVGEAHP